MSPDTGSYELSGNLRLSKDVMHHLALHIGETAFETIVVVGETFMV